MTSAFIKQLIEPQLIVAGPMYTANSANGVTAVIAAASAFNPTAGPLTVKVGITASGAGLVDANTVVSQVLKAGQSLPLAELVGQRVSPGHEIRATPTTIVLSVGGTELTGQ